MADERQPMSLQQLLDEPKGKTKYFADQAFMLHVFWEAPDMESAEKIISALQQCAVATHRDTPCVPTYHFRLSQLEADAVSPQPVTAGEHPQLCEAHRKLRMGVPRVAVEADLARRSIDPALLDLDLSDTLPAQMQLKPVMIECTEIYLDERSFFEHAGSKDYLKAYGEVMTPGLSNKATTVRLGSPTAYIIDKILAPMLKENVKPLQGDCAVWRPNGVSQPSIPLMLSINAVGSVDSVLSAFPVRLSSMTTTFVAFNHPLREGVVRIICVLPHFPDDAVLGGLGALNFMGAEVHCGEMNQEIVVESLHRALPDLACSVNSLHSGYVLHEKAAQLGLE